MSELLDNRAHRIRTMKSLVLELHRGEKPEVVRALLKDLIGQSDAGEVAAMEQELLADGVEVHELMGMCDLHSSVVGELLVEREHAPPVVGHPVDVFRRENAALRERVTALREALAAVLSGAGEGGDSPVPEPQLVAARAVFNELMDVEKHYARKENLLFPILERYGITGPSTVMWGKDDEARELLGALGDALGEAGATADEWRLVDEAVAAPAVAAVPLADKAGELGCSTHVAAGPAGRFALYVGGRRRPAPTGC